MNHFQTGSAPRFSISRKNGDPLSIEIEFSPPLKSDALFYALSQTYPEIDTHQLRLQKATIDFHTKEYEEEKAESAINNALPPLPKTNPASPWRASSHSSPSNSIADSPLNSQRNGKQPEFQSMIGRFEKTPGSRKAHGKRPMSQKDREEYKVVKNLGACPKHRKQKKRVRSCSS